MPGDEISRELPQVADELAGQYEILAPIATAGMGILLRARQNIAAAHGADQVHDPAARGRGLGRAFLA